MSRHDRIVARRSRRSRTAFKHAAITVSLAGILSGLCAAPAQAGWLSSSRITEYRLPTPLAGSCEIEFDSNGRAWIEAITGNAIVRFDPATKEFKNFPLAQPLAIPGGMEFGPDGALWFPEVTHNVVTRLDPADGSMRSYPIPAGLRVQGPLEVGTALGSDLTTGPDGAMWFSMSGVSAVGRIDIHTGHVDVIPLPTPLSSALLVTQIIQPGPGNTLVMSLGLANKIAIIDASTWEITEYDIPTPLAVPQGVTTDRDGYVWFTESAAQKFGRFDPRTGQFKEFDILALRGLAGLLQGGLGNPLPFPGPIRIGSDGKVYFAEGGFEAGNKIGEYDPKTGAFTEHVVPTPAAGICDLNNSQDGAIWFGEFTGNAIGKLNIA